MSCAYFQVSIFSIDRRSYSELCWNICDRALWTWEGERSQIFRRFATSSNFICFRGVCFGLCWLFLFLDARYWENFGSSLTLSDDGRTVSNILEVNSADLSRYFAFGCSGWMTGVHCFKIKLGGNHTRFGVEVGVSEGNSGNITDIRPYLVTNLVEGEIVSLTLNCDAGTLLLSSLFLFIYRNTRRCNWAQSTSLLHDHCPQEQDVVSVCKTPLSQEFCWVYILTNIHLTCWCFVKFSMNLFLEIELFLACFCLNSYHPSEAIN